MAVQMCSRLIIVLWLGCFLLSNLIVTPTTGSQDRLFYTFSATNSDGVSVSFDKFKGKVTLVTNVASYCGYTDDHYRGYVSLKQEYDDWLNILAFPCNQFGEQEPEDVHTIIREMRRRYKVNFEIFDKIEVVEGNIPDFWQYLNVQSKTTPQWNFYKYLVDVHGQVIGAWGPRVGVDHIKPYIEEAIKEAKTYHHREEL